MPNDREKINRNVQRKDTAASLIMKDQACCYSYLEQLTMVY